MSGSSPRSLRQAPRAWARAFSREPRDPGLPFRPQAGKQVQRACAAVGQQKTLRSIWPGRVRIRGRTVDLVSGEIAPEIIPMGQARAIDRPKAVRRLDVQFASAVHRLTCVVFANPIVCEGAGHKVSRENCQSVCVMIFQPRATCRRKGTPIDARAASIDAHNEVACGPSCF